MSTLGDPQSLFSTYHHLLLSTNTPLQPVTIKTDSLSYPSPTAPIGAHIPLISSPSTVEYGSPSSSSPPHPSSLSINTNASSIHLDAKFYSFEEFRVTLEEWMNVHFHPFRVASSEMLRESEGTLNEKFKYRYIVYHCAHYGNPRRRGAGKRPNQNYLPCGCTANLRLNYSFTDHCLKITTLKIEHTNHELSAEAFAKCAVKLKKSPSEDTPVPKKGKKRAASASTDDSGVGFSPVTKKKKKGEEKETSPLSTLSPTPPSDTPVSDTPTDTPPETTDSEWTSPAPPPNLPAPTPQRPSTTYNPLLPYLMQQHLLMGGMSTPLFNFSPQPSMNLLQPSSLEAQFIFKFNEGPVVTPVLPSSTDNKENSEFVDVENERPPSPQEYATLQPVKSEPPSHDYEPSSLVTSLQEQLMNGDPTLAASRAAELQNLLAKWGTPTPSI